jgi:predicted RNA binding protein with dsRBD fold (UPF0201 family)
MGPRLKGVQTKVTPKEDPTKVPTAKSAVFDKDMSARKYGSRSRMQDMLLSGKGFDRNGKAIKKVGNVWQFA